MATSIKKNTSKSVTFTQEATDQTLLAAIETALVEQQYVSFSELCKQALQQFLLAAASPSSPGSSAQLEQQFSQLTQQLEQIDGTTNQLLAQFQQQFAAFEQNLSKRESARFSQLENQLTQLLQQVERVETTNSQANQLDLQEPEQPVTSALKREPDPLLSRLGPLLEDF